METLAKAAFAAVTAGIAAAVIKKDNAPAALVLGIAASALVLRYMLDSAREMVSFLQNTAEESGIALSLYSPLLKAVGIGMLTRFSSDICRDAGQNAAASAIEMFGAVSAVCVSLPLVKAVLKMINTLV